MFIPFHEGTARAADRITGSILSVTYRAMLLIDIHREAGHSETAGTATTVERPFSRSRIKRRIVFGP